jgi:hypothetical protein
MRDDGTTLQVGSKPAQDLGVIVGATQDVIAVRTEKTTDALPAGFLSGAAGVGVVDVGRPRKVAEWGLAADAKAALLIPETAILSGGHPIAPLALVLSKRGGVPSIPGAARATMGSIRGDAPLLAISEVIASARLGGGQ